MSRPVRLLAAGLALLLILGMFWHSCARAAEPAVACTLRFTVPDSSSASSWGACQPLPGVRGSSLEPSTVRLYAEPQWGPRDTLLAEIDVRGLAGRAVAWILEVPDRLLVLDVRACLGSVCACESNKLVVNVARFLYPLWRPHP